MRYRLYIYGLKEPDIGKGAFSRINAALVDGSYESGQKCRIDKYIGKFDAKDIQYRIMVLLGDKCKIIIKQRANSIDHVAYLCIITAYDVIRDVLPWIHALAVQNDLVLYDEETDRTFYKGLIDEALVNMRNRQKALKKMLHESFCGIRRIRRIYSDEKAEKKEVAYAVIMERIRE